MGFDFFEGSYSLSDIVVVGEGEKFKVVDGVLFFGTMTCLIWCPYEKNGSYWKPHTITNIDKYAIISHRKLSSIVILDPITELVDLTFWNCENWRMPRFCTQSPPSVNVHFRSVVG